VEFEDFVRARGSALLRYGYVLTGNADDADDLVQEALLKLSDGWRRVRNKDNPESYVRMIMARQHISWWRRRRRELLTDDVPEGSHLDSHSFGELWKELATLPRRQRAVLVLRYYEDLSDQEIADSRNLPGNCAQPGVPGAPHATGQAGDTRKGTVVRSEDELIGALQSAATRAPEEGDLLADIARRRRRRSRRRAQALAVAAVVVIGVGAAGVRGVFSGEEGGRVAAPPSGDSTATAAVLPPSPATTRTLVPSAGKQGVAAAELWPEAVFTMPAKNADGWRYRPVTGLSATEVLLSAESSFEKAGKFEVYDSSTGTSRVVTTVPRTPGLDGYIPQTAGTDGRTLAWYAYGSKDGAAVREIWAVPLAGGEPKLLGTFTGEHAQMDAIGVDGEHVYWSERSGGVWRIPVAGGAAAQVPGSDGLHLLTWPYAVDVGNGPDDLDRNQSKLVDLASGQTTMMAALATVKGLRCGVSWCSGDDEQGPFAQKLDGTGTIRLASLSRSMRMIPFPILDRFLNAGTVIYDSATGKVAEIGQGSKMYGAGTSSEPSTIAYWDGEPGTFKVLNLAAVPPAQ
jgi:RNA polymerase sigma-70 factor (sigma-E family)